MFQEGVFKEGGCGLHLPMFASLCSNMLTITSENLHDLKQVHCTYRIVLADRSIYNLFAVFMIRYEITTTHNRFFNAKSAFETFWIIRCAYFSLPFCTKKP